MSNLMEYYIPGKRYVLPVIKPGSRYELPVIKPGIRYEIPGTTPSVIPLSYKWIDKLPLRSCMKNEGIEVITSVKELNDKLQMKYELVHEVKIPDPITCNISKNILEYLNSDGFSLLPRALVVGTPMVLVKSEKLSALNLSKTDIKDGILEHRKLIEKLSNYINSLSITLDNDTKQIQDIPSNISDSIDNSVSSVNSVSSDANNLIRNIVLFMLILTGLIVLLYYMFKRTKKK